METLSSRIPQVKQKVLKQSMIDSLFMIRGLAEAEIVDLRSGDEALREKTYEVEDALAGAMRQASRVMDMMQHFRYSHYHEKAVEMMGHDSVLKESVYQVLHAMSYECPLNRILVFKMIPAALSKVAMRTLHLDTILFQLIYNARKSIGEGSGIITIEADEKTKAGRQFISVRISDTGIGIAECDMPYVFDPVYSRVDRLRHTIALCIAKKLVEVNGGTMQAESSVRGNTFWMELPTK